MVVAGSPWVVRRLWAVVSGLVLLVLVGLGVAWFFFGFGFFVSFFFVFVSVFLFSFLFFFFFHSLVYCRVLLLFFSFEAFGLFGPTGGC